MSKNDAPEVEITELEKLELFVSKHYKSIVIVAAVIIGAVGVGVIAKDQINKANEKSMYAVSKATTEEELKSVIESESGNKAVISAQLKLAKLYTDEKKYDDVKSVYLSILKSNAIESVKNRIKLNQIALEELQGDIDTAIADYKAVGSDLIMSEEVRAEANYAYARLLVSKDKKDEAKVILAQLAAKSSAWSYEADQMLKRL